LKILFSIPLKNLGALTTTTFTKNPSSYFFKVIQTPAPIRHSPSKVIRTYLGMEYARKSPAPIAIKKYPAAQFGRLQQHFRFLNIQITRLLISLYSHR
jgi:hypothetical protein